MNFSSILQSINNGSTIENEIVKHPEYFEDLVYYLEEHNLTIEEALALNAYSEDSRLFNHYNPNLNNIDEIALHYEKEGVSRLVLSGCTLEQACDALSFVRNIAYGCNLNDKYEWAKNYASENLMPSRAVYTLLSIIKDMHKIEHLPELYWLINNALDKSISTERTVVYRGAQCKYDDDLTVLHPQGFLSTSESLETSFAKYEQYPCVLEIEVPAGTRAMNIAPFSDYGDAEKEILITGVKLYVDEIAYCETDNGEKQVVICFADNAHELEPEIE